MEFDNASAEEILQYKQILNSIDRTAPGSASSSLNLNNAIRRDIIIGKDSGEPLKGSFMDRLKSTAEVKRKSSVGLVSTLLTSSSAGVSTGSCVRKVQGSSPTNKKKRRGKSASLPQLFKSQKELDYLEYLTSSSRLGQQAIQIRCKSHQFTEVSDYTAIWIDQRLVTSRKAINISLPCSTCRYIDSTLHIRAIDYFVSSRIFSYSQISCISADFPSLYFISNFIHLYLSLSLSLSTSLSLSLSLPSSPTTSFHCRTLLLFVTSSFLQHSQHPIWRSLLPLKLYGKKAGILDPSP